MRKLLMLLTLTVTLLACKTEPNVDYALFSGKIENPTGKTIVVRGGDFNQVINLNDDGTFADTLRIDTGYFTFNHGREGSSMFLSQGDDLNLSLNATEFDETITYAGVGAESNNYLAAKYINNEQNNVDVPTLYIMEQKEFLEAVNKLNTSNEAFLSDAKGLNKGFAALEKKNNSYDYLLNLQQYPSYHEYFAKKENVEVSDEFTNPLKGFDFANDADYKNSSAYKRLVQNHYALAIKESEDVSAIFDNLKTVNAPALKADLAKMLAYNVSPSNENNEALYNGIISLSVDEKFKTKLTTKYNKVKLLAKGMPSPIFTNYENHKGGKTSLEDLKGKFVYVDVWATWCGPCKREIPFLKEVESNYHGKNIEFVSTSIDKSKDHQVWVAMVKDKALGGIQLFADSDWQSKFVQDYAIEGIPRFILVDPQGNIVTADAPRPSDPKLIELFNELKI